MSPTKSTYGILPRIWIYRCNHVRDFISKQKTWALICARLDRRLGKHTCTNANSDWWLVAPSQKIARKLEAIIPAGAIKHKQIILQLPARL